MKRKPIEHITHKEAVERSYNCLTHRQKAMLRAILSAAMLIGSYTLTMAIDTLCIIFNLNSIEELKDELAALFDSPIEDWETESGSRLYYKWLEGVVINKKTMTVDITIHELIFNYMRIHYNDEKRRLELETL